jgi:hypothetical protein
MLVIYCRASAGRLIVLSLIVLSRPLFGILAGGARFIGERFGAVDSEDSEATGFVCTVTVELG